MKIALHDFSGHPFQAELARELARMGHDVDHVSAAQYVSGKGQLELQPGDASSLTFTGLHLALPFQKYAPLARLRFERAYAREWIKHLQAAPPNIVIACNLPLVSMFLFARHAKRTGLPYVMWHQDVYSSAMTDELKRRMPGPIARFGGGIFRRLEAYCVRNADHVVAIGDAFREFYVAWNVAAEKVSVIPNWAPLDKVYPVDRSNQSSARLFDDVTSLRLVYAGTLGRKHNPQLLLDLLRNAIASDIPAALAVISQGEAADALAEDGRAQCLPMRVVPFQPAEDLPDLLSSADVLVALLEPGATKFSIPSKVLSYMAAGRPILGLMPNDNPAAADILLTGGHVMSPDTLGVRTAVIWLADLHRHREKVTSIGRRSRRIAEQKFDIAQVSQRFEEILTDSTRGPD